jgi:alkaline phosphatase D
MEFNRRDFLASASSLALFPSKAFANNRPSVELALPNELKRLCFGSCNNHNRDQDHWDMILSKRPDLFLMLGDNIYADTIDMNKMREKYNLLKANSYFKNFREQIPIRGTWDDHDYGDNNAGSEYPMKRESQVQFCDFFDIPKDSPRRSRTGIYETYSIGEGEREIRIILLDTRYHRDRRESVRRDILGEEQWLWLEETLRHSTAKAHVICSSICVLNNNINFTEDWGDFPWAESRLWDLMDETNPKNPIFLTGDKHFAGFFQKPRGRFGKIYTEVMSSGLTHSIPFFLRPIYRRFYDGKTYMGKNFGCLDFNFSYHSPKIEIKIFDKKGRLRISENIPLTDI